MAKRPYEIEINQDTPQEDLERCILAAAHTSDTNFQRAAANAKAELAIRERQEREHLFNAQSSERVKGQKFQQAETDRQLEVARSQVDVAKSQVGVSELLLGKTKWAAIAATLSAIFLFGLLIVQIIRLVRGD